MEWIYREYLDNEKVTVYNFKVDDYHTYFVGINSVWVHNAECEIEFTNKSGLDKKEFKKQLKEQQDGLGDLTIDEYRNNRKAFNDRKANIGNGRDSNSAKYQAKLKRQEIATKAKEYRNQGKTPKEARKLAKEWAKGKVALHAPDQIAGGYANNFSGLGDCNINSSIGSQWKSKVSILDNYINGKATKLPGTTKLSELDIEFVLK